MRDRRVSREIGDPRLACGLLGRAHDSCSSSLCGGRRPRGISRDGRLWRRRGPGALAQRIQRILVFVFFVLGVEQLQLQLEQQLEQLDVVGESPRRLRRRVAARGAHRAVWFRRRDLRGSAGVRVCPRWLSGGVGVRTVLRRPHGVRVVRGLGVAPHLWQRLRGAAARRARWSRAPIPRRARGVLCPGGVPRGGFRARVHVSPRGAGAPRRTARAGCTRAHSSRRRSAARAAHGLAGAALGGHARGPGGAPAQAPRPPRHGHRERGRGLRARDLGCAPRGLSGGAIDQRTGPSGHGGSRPGGARARAAGPRGRRMARSKAHALAAPSGPGREAGRLRLGSSRSPAFPMLRERWPCSTRSFPSSGPGRRRWRRAAPIGLRRASVGPSAGRPDGGRRSW